ncbi:MAG TPA: hypothetical protein VGF55_33675, partial [Gemmataceae bacterium]
MVHLWGDRTECGAGVDAIVPDGVARLQQVTGWRPGFGRSSRRPAEAGTPTGYLLESGHPVRYDG